MLEELDKLIIFINEEYNKINSEWQQDNSYVPIHQKRNLIKDVNADNEILNIILKYRLFLNEKHLDLKLAFNNLNLDNEVNSRVKSQNSIEFKLNNYMSEKHEYGEIPLNKCFNDIYGIRIILKEKLEHNVIKDFIENKYDKDLKCIDSSTGEYLATHIYFKRDNYSFQWELQIWDKEHEKTNILSHEKYKQDYTKWEKENKGGASI